MALCHVCLTSLRDGDEICAYHTHGWEPNWAAANKLYCDFFHRSVPLPKPQERDPEFTGEA